MPALVLVLGACVATPSGSGSPGASNEPASPTVGPSGSPAGASQPGSTIPPLDTGPDALAAMFAAEAGYATPKVDVRGAVFDASGRLLMVRELVDGGRWTLPGGWADVNQTASACAVREVLEESGYVVRAAKLALVQDRGRQGHHPTGPF